MLLLMYSTAEPPKTVHMQKPQKDHEAMIKVHLINQPNAVIVVGSFLNSKFTNTLKILNFEDD